MTDLYPLLLSPTLHTRVWGGRTLQTRYGKPLPTDQPYGESWELHDTSTVANGVLAGRTVGDLTRAYGAALVGTASDPAEGFPLLVKLLDCNDWLSVQVHPDDALALELEGEPRGKTEAWILLDATEGARIVVGIEAGASLDAVASAIRENRLEPLLSYQVVSAGDVVYMAAGTVHALGPGVLVYEIQQSSDQTYRLYDWGRVGLDGQPRQLHIDKSLRAARLGVKPPITRLADSADDGAVLGGAYFVTVRHVVAEGAPVQADTGGVRFHALTCTAGALTVTAGEAAPVQFGAGQTVLVPAAVGAYVLSGAGEALRSSQPV
ncbi:MAG: class I mannose-6-phosphate isomerase [Anaerolineae bacterium]|jgi:mannose-6-phosphate isomerase|nr:class I mannose-6-phosphate isomerase [Anaerolineae bacterium]